MPGRPRAKLVTGYFDITDDRRYNLIGIQRAAQMSRMSADTTQTQETAPILGRCPRCGCAIHEKNIPRHLKRVHSKPKQ